MKTRDNVIYGNRYHEDTDCYDILDYGEQEAQCDGCGHWFDVGEVKEIAGENFCKECAEKYFDKCYNCEQPANELIPCKLFESIGDNTEYMVCEKCYKEYLEEIELRKEFDRATEDLLHKIDKLNNRKAS